MSELISGKDALIALGNGEDVEFKDGMDKWDNIKNHMNLDLSMFLTAPDWMSFRLKPRTIKINGIEVPAPFKPKDGETCCYLSDESVDGYHTVSYNMERYSGMIFGLYRESEIKQVVAALRSVFNERD